MTDQLYSDSKVLNSDKSQLFPDQSISDIFASEDRLTGKNYKPEFSKKRGFYADSFALMITSDEPKTYTRYTIDFSKPGREKGTLYTGPYLYQLRTSDNSATKKLLLIR